MATQPKPFFTPGEYLAMEREAEYKSEYIDGQIWAMAGATEEHILVTGNVAAELRTRLKGRPCRTYSTDMRVQVGRDGLYTYPDVVVVCGEPRFLDARKDTLLNPLLIVEVLSESTEAYDRGLKFARYRALESLREYVLISQTSPLVERYVRKDNGTWLYSAAEGLEASVALDSLGCVLPLAEVYDRVEFPALQTPPGRG
jgi:Uma2 family endonuclease